MDDGLFIVEIENVDIDFLGNVIYDFIVVVNLF